MFRAEINLKDTIGALKREYSTFPGSKFTQAVVTALRKTGEQAKTQAARTIAKRYKIKVGEAKEAITLIPPSKNSSIIQAVIKAKNKRIPLLRWAKYNALGRNVKVNVTGSTKKMPMAFLATMKNGHQGIFFKAESSAGYVLGSQKKDRLKTRRKRSPFDSFRGTKEQWRKNTPISELFGISYSTATAQPIAIEAMKAKASEKFGPLLAHELARKAGKIAGART